MRLDAHIRSDAHGDVDGRPRRLWVEFEYPLARFTSRGPIGLAGPAGPPWMIGVTGWDAGDCCALVRRARGNAELPRVETVVWDVDVSTLDPTMVLPHVGNSAARGVWYAGPMT
jgi:hypothetical protein